MRLVTSKYLDSYAIINPPVLMLDKPPPSGHKTHKHGHFTRVFPLAFRLLKSHRKALATNPPMRVEQTTPTKMKLKLAIMSLVALTAACTMAQAETNAPADDTNPHLRRAAARRHACRRSRCARPACNTGRERSGCRQLLYASPLPPRLPLLSPRLPAHTAPAPAPRSCRTDAAAANATPTIPPPSSRSSSWTKFP